MRSGPGLAGRRTLVTGATGYLGPALCRHLAGRGALVHAVSRGADPGDREGVRWWRADLAEIADARELLSGIEPEGIFHLAGLGKGGPALELVLPTFRANVVTTVNVLTAAAEGGRPRVILAGSMEEPVEPQEVPFSPYAAGKWAGSIYGRMFHRLFQLPVVVARIFMTYGPGHQPEGKLFPYVIRSILRGRPPELSSGERLVDWIYIDDLVEGLAHLAETEGLEGRTLDLGSGELVSVRRIVEEILEITGSRLDPRFGEAEERPTQEPRAANTTETLRLTGWQPATARREGLRRTIAWHERELAGSGHGAG
jgi:UDP-glucose 4-epimerase